MISTREEFLKFAKNCRDDFYSYGKVFSLENDIDLSGTSFQGIPYFQGTLEGNGHVISGAKNCRDDFYSYGKVFSLENDIDLSGTSFQGIPYFQGTLEGNGHVISGLLMIREGSDYGLFRYVGKAGKIKDLKVSGKVV